MGKTYDEIPPDLAAWILKQEMFFTASAPLRGSGRVNLSPKGIRGTFHIADAHRVWYEDLTGSGSETMAHLREPENGRITLMFTALDAAPRILRIYGRGTVREFGSPEYDALVPPAARRPGSRCAVVVDVHRVATSCGWGVPVYTFRGQRPTLVKWCAGLEAHDRPDDAHPEKGMRAWWTEWNVRSIDDEPAMLSAHVSPKALMHVPRSPEEDGLVAKLVKAEADSGKAWGLTGTKVGTVGKGVQSAEMVRLVIAFSIGLAAAAVYVNLARVPCV